MGEGVSGYITKADTFMDAFHWRIVEMSYFAKISIAFLS